MSKKGVFITRFKLGISLFLLKCISFNPNMDE